MQIGQILQVNGYAGVFAFYYVFTSNLIYGIQLLTNDVILSFPLLLYFIKKGLLFCLSCIFPFKIQ